MTELYCICKTPYDADKFMICCDHCEGWFHVECIGMSEEQAEKVSEYICPNCETILERRTSWKPECARPSCTESINDSVYCSLACRQEDAGDLLGSVLYKAQSAESPELELLRSKIAKLEAKELSLMKRINSLTERKMALLDAVFYANFLSQQHEELICGFDLNLARCSFNPDALDWVSPFEKKPENICMQVNCKRHGKCKTPVSSLNVESAELPETLNDDQELFIPQWAHLMCNSIDLELELLEKKQVKNVQTQLKELRKKLEWKELNYIVVSTEVGQVSIVAPFKRLEATQFGILHGR